MGVVGKVIKMANSSYAEKWWVQDMDGTSYWPMTKYLAVLDDPGVCFSTPWEISQGESETGPGKRLIFTMKICSVSRSGAAAKVRISGMNAFKEIWLPVSQVPALQITVRGATVNAWVPNWLVAKKGIEKYAQLAPPTAQSDEIDFIEMSKARPVKPTLREFLEPYLHPAQMVITTVDVESCLDFMCE